MKNIKKQINESFFNPVLHFLPIIVFMLVDGVWGLQVAWWSSLSVAFLVAVYVFVLYRKILEWFLFSSGIYLSVGFLTTLLNYFPVPIELMPVNVEIVLLIVFTISLLFKKRISNFIHGRHRKMFSMTNNLDEMFRMIWILGSVIFLYVHLYFILTIIKIPNLANSLTFIHSAYLAILLFILFYELLRVTIVRIRLTREEWWPIVNVQGKMIGSIQHQISLNSEEKYMHPIIRVMLIDNNRVYLQKRSETNLVFPGFWDTAVSNHVKVSETIDQCILRTAEQRFGFETMRPLFLSNYIHETAYEFHYAFLFVACTTDIPEYNKKFIDHAKWWTVKQIEDNLEAGIFTDNFKTEFDLLKRSGLLESETCDCECALKDLVTDGMRKLS